MVVRESANVTLTCKATGYPEPYVMWRREDGKDINYNGENGKSTCIMLRFTVMLSQKLVRTVRQYSNFWNSWKQNCASIIKYTCRFVCQEPSKQEFITLLSQRRPVGTSCVHASSRACSQLSTGKTSSLHSKQPKTNASYWKCHSFVILFPYFSVDILFCVKQIQK